MKKLTSYFRDCGVLFCFFSRYTKSDVWSIHPTMSKGTSWRSLCTVSNSPCKYTMIREDPRSVCFSKRVGGSAESESNSKKNLEQVFNTNKIAI